MNADEDRLARLERKVAKLETAHATLRLAVRRGYASAKGKPVDDENYPDDPPKPGGAGRCRSVEAWEDGPTGAFSPAEGSYAVYGPKGPWVAAAILLLLSGPAAAQTMIPMVPQPTSPVCSTYAEAKKILEETYREEPVTRGISGDGWVMEVWSSVEGRTWTSLRVSPEGVACVTGGGTHLEVRAVGAKGEET